MVGSAEVVYNEEVLMQIRRVGILQKISGENASLENEVR